jgi:BMFP domain-containing protein YqiC
MHPGRLTAERDLLNYVAKLLTGPAPMAFDPRLLDDLARRLASAVPEGVVALRRDLEQNFKPVLQSGLARLDLVTREEFDVQAAVLRRTREKLVALEERLKELEAK